MYNWTKYLHVCDKKDKIIKKYKRNDYREIMRFVDESNKKLYAIAKWVRNFVMITKTKTTIFQLSNENVEKRKRIERIFDRALNLRIISIRFDKIKRMMKERNKEWLIDVMSSSSLREREEIDAKSTSVINTIEMKKKRNDDAKTMKDLRAKIIQIAKLYEFKAKKMMSAFD